MDDVEQAKVPVAKAFFVIMMMKHKCILLDDHDGDILVRAMVLMLMLVMKMSMRLAMMVTVLNSKP